MKFIHLRCKDSKGNILPKGGTTIGYELLPKPLISSPRAVAYTVSHCNPVKDHFNKRIGRLVCEGRFKRELFVAAIVLPDSDTRKLSQIVLEDYKSGETSLW